MTAVEKKSNVEGSPRQGGKNTEREKVWQKNTKINFYVYFIQLANWYIKQVLINHKVFRTGFCRNFALLVLKHLIKFKRVKSKEKHQQELQRASDQCGVTAWDACKSDWLKLIGNRKRWGTLPGTASHLQAELTWSPTAVSWDGKNSHFVSFLHHSCSLMCCNS